MGRGHRVNWFAPDRPVNGGTVFARPTEDTMPNTSLDDVMAKLGINPDTPITKPCCDTPSTAGAHDWTETVCDHGCCTLWWCGFCHAPDGAVGPAGCPCGCMDRHEEGPPA